MIQVNDITFSYPGSKHKVFDRLSLNLKDNHIYGLLGKNGTKERVPLSTSLLDY